MKFIKQVFCSLLAISATMLYAQEEPAKERETGHVNQNKFRQMYNEFATPNMFRTASGAPGPAYYQQQADYKMDIELDDKNMKLYGLETITYHNNSPDNLEYLWVQLDQNVREKNSPSPLRNPTYAQPAFQPNQFTNTFLSEPFDGGFNIEHVKVPKVLVWIIPLIKP